MFLNCVGAIVGTMSPLVGLIPGAAPIAAGVGSIGGIVSGLGSLTGDAFGAPAPDKTFQKYGPRRRIRITY